MSNPPNTPRPANVTAFKSQRRNSNRAEATLKREIDAGVRYFWSKRGDVPYLNARGGVA